MQLDRTSLPPPPPRSAVAALREALFRALPDGVVRDDAEARERFATDESGAGAFAPDLVSLPRSTAEVSTVLELCARHGVPVTPRGAGSGRAGGALAVCGGLVLGLERMNRVRSIEPASLLAVAEPGVITGELQSAVEEAGLFYPPDPNSLEYCHLGGNVATNAGGPRAVKYGVTREYVLGVEAVRMGGEVLRVGRRTIKGVAGYDLTAILTGSEGTLAVITEVTVRLRPRPPRVETALVFFPSIEAASRAVLDVFRAGHLPRTLEMMDPASIEAVRPQAPFRFPEGERAALILEVDGEGDEVFEELCRIAERIEASQGASEILVAKSASERADLWASRRIMSPALRELHGHKYSEDIAVPLEHIPRTIERVHEIAAAHSLTAAIYGHAGDGNLHVNLLFADESAWPEVLAAARAVFEETLRVGGTISGEHGIGLLKRDFLPLEHSAPLLALQREVKRVFDPAGLMNPGKLLPGAGA